MSKTRPFVPPRVPVPEAKLGPAPPFPSTAAPSTRPQSTERVAFKPPPLVPVEPEIDLQELLDAAQREVDALQAHSESQQEALAVEKSRFHTAFGVLEASRARACRVLAKDAVELGIEIGRALATRAFEVDQAQLTTLMEQCLLDFSRTNPIQVRVARSDAPHVQGHLQTEEATSITVLADDDLGPGDLVVEAEQLVVDARLQERLTMLRDELAATVRADERLALNESEDAPAQPDGASERGDADGDDVAEPSEAAS